MNNVGNTDRKIRIVLALVLTLLYFTKVIPPDYGDISLGIAGLLAITSFRKCCPLYALLGFGTCGIDTGNNKIRIKTKKLEI